MSSSLIITLEIALVLGSVLGFAGWELWRLRRDRRRPSDTLPTEPMPDESRS